MRIDFGRTSRAGLGLPQLSICQLAAIRPNSREGHRSADCSLYDPVLKPNDFWGIIVITAWGARVKLANISLLDPVQSGDGTTTALTWR
jgi:hypothetical protein